MPLFFSPLLTLGLPSSDTDAQRETALPSSRSPAAAARCCHPGASLGWSWRERHSVIFQLGLQVGLCIGDVAFTRVSSCLHSCDICSLLPTLALAFLIHFLEALAPVHYFSCSSVRKSAGIGLGRRYIPPAG